MTGFYRWSILASLGLFACGAETPAAPGGGGSGSGPPLGQAGTNPVVGGAGGSGNPTAGTNGQTGGAMTGGGMPGTSGATVIGGSAPVGGSGGSAPLGGSGGSGGSGTTKTLKVDAAPGEHLHKVGGRDVGLDNRVPQLMGKLIVNLDVDAGGIYQFGLKHGFHVYGAKLPVHCEIAESQQAYTQKTTAFNGNCRLETFDGIDHDPTTTIDPAQAVANVVKNALTELQGTYPEEDWGFYLNDDGSVRWSDVGVTGYSHGATSAARWAKKYNFWRIVSRSGPRDNICGNQQNCPAGIISAWLDEPTVTPIANYYGFVGNGDSQYGDIIFAMARMNYVGEPANITSGTPPYGGSHRLFIAGGHSDFTDKAFWPAMGVAWGVPQNVMDYAATH